MNTNPDSEEIKILRLEKELAYVIHVNKSYPYISEQGLENVKELYEKLLDVMAKRNIPKDPNAYW